MRYLLTVLTNGRPEYLGRSLAAFAEHVTPKPTEVYVYDDSAPDHTLGPTPETVQAFIDADLAPLPSGVRLGSAEKRIGMCAAHARCWEAAAKSDLDWVFHIEDDQRILCPIDLLDLADLLTSFDHLVQMTLMRTPWGAEVEYGGYVPQSPDWYHWKEQPVYGGYCQTQRWFETTRNWATSPTLFSTALAREFPWSPEPGCETEIGPRILAARPDARFGIYGGGECHAAHIGVERAPGATGY
jgi:hypothetical protein